jgi:ABC-type Fe3+ transport system permease subunit/sugar lactone lactonase YvrE
LSYLPVQRRPNVAAKLLNAAENWAPSVLLWAVLFVCCVLPLGWLAGQTVLNPSVFRELRLDSFRLRLLGRTLLFNGAAAVIATAMALPAAIVLGRGRGKVAAMLWIALPVSLLLPSLVFAYGWKQFFRLMGKDFTPAGFADTMRCIWTLATWLWPLPAAVIGLSLRRLDAQVQEQAALDGALWRVTFRQLLPAIIASGCVVMVLAMQEFAVYEPTGISVVATEVRMVFETGAFSSPDNPITQQFGFGGGTGGLAGQPLRAGAAVAVSMPLLLVVALLCATAAVAARKLSALEQMQVGDWPRALDAPRWLSPLSIALFLLTVAAPIVAMTLSLKRSPNPMRIWNEFSPQVIGSLALAGSAGIVALVVGQLATMRAGKLAGMVAGLTFLVGGQLLAIALIRVYNRAATAWVYDGPAIAVLAYVARFGWIAILAGHSTWGRPWRGVREMATVDGATPLQTASRIIWPLAWPALAAAGVLVMILALTEVPATVLLSPQRPQPLVPMLMTWVHMLRYDAMIEASLLMCAMVLILGAGAVALDRLRARATRALLTRVGMILLVVATMWLSGCADPKKPQEIWCETGTGPDQVVYPRGITYDPQDDSFFVVDRMARVQHLDHQGRFLNEWRMPDFALGKPVGLSVGPDGLVYIPDTHYHRVRVYQPDGTFVREWGSFGNAPGQFIYPTDIAFDSKDNIFVGEYGDHDRISVFDHDGKYLYEVGRFGQGDGEFSRPQSLLIDTKTDTLYITDACNHRIVVFKTDGTWVKNIGHTGSAPGEFRFPYGLDMDREGNLIVCEFGNNRVQKIDPQTGKALAVWGTSGREPGALAYPWAVAVDRRDRVIAVDSGNNRLQVFRF